MPIRTTFDLFIAGIAVLLGIAMDVFLLSVFKSHLQRVAAVSRYRPVYLRSGRRNRVRY